MSLTDELEKLKRLRADGDITEEEYDRAKAKLLGEKSVSLSVSAFGSEVSPLGPEAEEKETRLWGLLLHLSCLAGYAIPLGGIIAPIAIWQIKKEQLPLIDQHGKNAVNWIISELIYIVVCIPLIFLMIGIPLLIAVAVLGIVFPIIAAIKANNGEVWRYPLSIRFMK